MRARGVGWLVAASAVGFALSAFAAPSATVRLRGARDPGAEQCPTDDELRREIAARIGWDPFGTDPGHEVLVRFALVANRLLATVEIRDPSGALVGSRTFHSRGQDCVELARAVELTVAMAVDPLRHADETPESRPLILPDPLPESFPEAMPVSPAPPAADSARPSLHGTTQASPRVPLELFAGGAVLTSIGTTPGLAAGAALELGFRRAALSVALEARATLPSSADVGSGTVSAYPLLGLLVACYRYDRLGACGLLGGGVLRGEGHALTDARHETTGYGVAGARLVLEQPLGRALALQIQAELLVPLQTTELRVDQMAVWASPVVAGAAGLALVVRFR